MIDLQNPWTWLAGVIVGSPLFLTLVNRWLARGDRASLAQTTLRHDFIEYIAGLETKLAERGQELDDCKDQKYKLQDELLALKYPHLSPKDVVSND